jgi:hypothetical protein
MSIGTDRVRASFNPSSSLSVDNIKSKSAELIDYCEGFKGRDPERDRLAALAQTAYEEAAMWAVKALTG